MFKVFFEPKASGTAARHARRVRGGLQVPKPGAMVLGLRLRTVVPCAERVVLGN